MSRQTFSIIYLCILVFSSTVALRHSGKKELRNIAAFLICTLISETLVICIIPKGSCNHYIYALGNLLSGASVLYYFRTIVAKQYFTIFCLAILGLMLFFYIRYTMWMPQTIMELKHVAGYYTLLFMASLLFVWEVITSEKNKRNSKPLWFGVCFMLFYILAFLNNTPQLANVLNEKDIKYFLLVSHIANLSFYGSLGILMLKLPTVNKH